MVSLDGQPGSLLFSMEGDHGLNSSLTHFDRFSKSKEDGGDGLSRWLEPRSMWHVRLSRLVRAAAAQDPYPGTTLIEHVGHVLAMRGHAVTLQRGEGGGCGTQCFKNLRHTFLSVVDEENDDDEEFIVELAFRDQFAIPLKSRRYEALLASIPQTLVIKPSDLTPLVEAVCRELRRAFQESRLDLPPWRQARSLLSKWRPRRAHERTLLLPEPVCPAVTTRATVSGDSEPGSPESPWVLHGEPGSSPEALIGGSPRAVLAGGRPGGLELLAATPIDAAKAKRRSLLSWNLALHPAPAPSVRWGEAGNIRVVRPQGPGSRLQAARAQVLA